MGDSVQRSLKVIGTNQQSHFLLDIVGSNALAVEIAAVFGDMHSINRINSASLSAAPS